jgi:hypothetical protein
VADEMKKKFERGFKEQGRIYETGSETQSVQW